LRALLRIAIASVVAVGLAVALVGPASAEPVPEEDQVDTTTTGARVTGTIYWKTTSYATMNITVTDTDFRDGHCVHAEYFVEYVSDDPGLQSGGTSPLISIGDACWNQSQSYSPVSQSFNDITLRTIKPIKVLTIKVFQVGGANRSTGSERNVPGEK
jgi:hypothetical protein